MQSRNILLAVVICLLLGGSSPVCGCNEAIDTTHIENDVLTLVDRIILPAVKGRIDHMAYDSVHHLVFIAALANNTVEVVNIHTKEKVHTITGLQEPQGVLYIPSLQRLVVANGVDGSCVFYNTENYTEIKRLQLKGDADNIRYDPASNFVYVGYGNGGISVLDPVQMKIITAVHLDGHPESFQLDQELNRLYINVPDADKTQVVDLTTLNVINNWKNTGASSNFPMALDKDDHRLFIGYRHPAKVHVVDTRTGKGLASFACSGDADDLFYDAADSLLFVSAGEGFIDVFKQKQNDYALINQIPTRKGSRTSLWLTVEKTLLVAVPAHGNNEAALWIYKRTSF